MNDCEYGEVTPVNDILIFCKNQEYCENQMNFGNTIYCRIPLDKKSNGDGLEKKVENE